MRCVTSARAPHSGAAAGRPATRNIPTTPAAAGTSVCVFGGFHLASQSLSPRNPLHVPPPASAAPLSPLPSPTGSRSSPRRCVWAGDAVGVPPHPSTFCVRVPAFFRKSFGVMLPPRVAFCSCLVFAIAKLFGNPVPCPMSSRPLLTRLSDLHLFFSRGCVSPVHYRRPRGRRW